MKKLVLIGCLVLLAVGCVAFAGCGSGGDNSVQGVYKLEAGEDFTATVTLKANNEASYSITEGEGLPVTYKVEDDTVVLIGMDGKEITEATFKITDDGLRDPAGNLYKKQ